MFLYFFCTRIMYACLTCQKSKIEHKKLPEKLKLIEISIGKWDNIFMNFVSGLPRSPNGCDVIWVIVDQSTNSTRFILMNIEYSLEKLVRQYENQIGLYRILTFDILMIEKQENNLSSNVCWSAHKVYHLKSKPRRKEKEKIFWFLSSGEVQSESVALRR